MHKLGLGIMAAAAAFSIAAFAQSGNGPGSYCNANNNFGDSHDVCVACVKDYYSAVCQCKLAQEENPQEFDAFFGNLGQCIKYVNEYGPFLP